MMKFLTILFLLPSFLQAQNCTTYVRVGYEDLIDSVYEKIIDCKYMDFKDGSEPGEYYSVASYYREPPGYFEIMKWYWTEFPNNYNGWKIEHKGVFSFTGDTEGTIGSIVNMSCDSCGYLDKYSYDVVIDYGYNDACSLKVTQNKDSTDKYFQIEYPDFPKSITKRKK